MVHRANSAALRVCASQDGWQGSVQDLARLLGTRFGLEPEPLFTRLLGGGEVVLADAISPDDAQYLCDVLSRMGIRGVVRPTEIGGGRPEPQDTVIDARGGSRGAADTVYDGIKPSNERPTFEADHRSVNLSHNDVPARRAPSAQTTLQWTSSQQYAIDQLTAADQVHRTLTPHSGPGSVDDSVSEPDRHAVQRVAPAPEGFEEDFGHVWSSLLADPEPGPPPVEDRAALWATLRGELDAREWVRDIFNFRGEEEVAAVGTGNGLEDRGLASSRPAGWATVLGEPLSDVAPRRPPSLEDALEDRTAQWEISFEAVDLDDEFSKSADDLLRELDDNTDVMHVSTEELLRVSATDLPPRTAFPVTRTPTPQVLAQAMSATPRAIPARIASGDPAHKVWVSGLLSAVVPGAGQVYNGQVGKGLMFGVASVLLIPWLLSVVDAVTVGRHIAAGRLRPPHAGRPVVVAIFCLIVGPALGWFAHQAGEAIAARLDHGIAAPYDTNDARDSAVQARGAATIEIERAFYRADRTRQAMEEELERSRVPLPGHPAYGLSARERARRATVMLSQAQEACDSKDTGGCLRLVNEAVALDPTNKLGWSLLVRVRKRQASWVLPVAEEPQAPSVDVPDVTAP